ncbi:uncharacterized protein LOC141855982 [Brevipalpus obovatus]|uniref:uncharacterized protein LOC141855982 n=1 Tax=Brevipalpus obovatus TaxID=246614 RepID=UPI003D9E5F3C
MQQRMYIIKSFETIDQEINHSKKSHKLLVTDRQKLCQESTYSLSNTTLFSSITSYTVLSIVFLLTMSSKVIQTSASETAKLDLMWCLNHNSFYHEVKICSMLRPGHPIYQIDFTRPTEHSPVNESSDSSSSTLVIRLIDEEQFKVDRTTLVYTGGKKLSSDPVAIFLVRKHTDKEEVVNCMLLKLDVSDRHCSYVRNCTTVISILASLCLILIMGLSITLIILHRKSPINCKFWLKKSEDIEDDGYFNDNQPDHGGNDQGFISPRKPSYAPTDKGNGSIIRPNFSPPSGYIVPRKSSLKASKIEVVPVKDDPLKNSANGTGRSVLPGIIPEDADRERRSFENEGYEESESSRRNSTTNETETLSSPADPEAAIPPNNIRRKSTVTFSDKTEIIRIMKCS